MGSLAAQASLAASVQSFCCQFGQDRRSPNDSAAALAPARVCLTLTASRRSGFIRRSQDGTTEQGTEKGGRSSSKVEQEQKQDQDQEPAQVATSSPFATAGKISSRLAAGKALKQQDPAPKPSSSSSFPPPQSILDASDQIPGSSSKPVPSPASSPFSPKPGGSVPFPNSSPVKPDASSRSSSKAFPAPPPAVSSPFDGQSLPPRRRRASSAAEIDERILASRKEMLDALWRERRQQPRMNVAPADIFDDPKASDSDKEYKFELIRGTNPIVLVVSFSIIVGIMFGTAFVAWKLGAFHYDEY